MSTNILLAVDAARPGPVAGSIVPPVLELVRDSADHVVVLYVREFSVLHIGRMMADHGGTVGQQAVDGIVSRLRAGGVQASGLVREADIGHVAATIVAAARDVDARVIVLGPGRPGRLPGPRPGSVAARVLDLATRPVLVVPVPAERVVAPAAAR